MVDEQIKGIAINTRYHYCVFIAIYLCTFDLLLSVKKRFVSCKFRLCERRRILTFFRAFEFCKVRFY